MTPDTIVTLINLGSAGAVIAVVIIFLNYLEKRDKNWQDFFTALNASNEQDMRAVRESLQKVCDSLTCLTIDLHNHDDKVDDRIAAIQRIDKRANTRPDPRANQ